MIAVAVVVLLCVALAVAEALVRRAERRLPPFLLWHDQLTTGKWLQMRALRREPPVDVLLAGSSQMLFALDPTAMPARSYNCAIYRGIPTVMTEWLRDEVLPALRPRHVVWGVSILDLNDNGGFHKGITARYAAGRPRYGLAFSLRRHVALARRWRLVTTPLRLLRLARPGPVEVGAEGKPLSRLLGPAGKGMEYADYDTYMLTDEKRAFIETEMVNAFSTGGAQAAALREGARLVLETGASLVFLEMPYTREFADMYPPGAVDEGRSLLGSIAAEAGVAFVPTDGDALPRDWYADCVHLNGVGQREWTARMGPAVMVTP